MLYPWLIPGKKLECINAEGWSDPFTGATIEGPMCGDVVTLLQVHEAFNPSNRDGLGVRLEEWPDRICSLFSDKSGKLSFRPIEDKDNEMFQSWVNKLPTSDKFPVHPQQEPHLPTTPTKVPEEA